jgi:hypothetical protein
MILYIYIEEIVFQNHKTNNTTLIMMKKMILIKNVMINVQDVVMEEIVKYLIYSCSQSFNCFLEHEKL